MRIEPILKSINDERYIDNVRISDIIEENDAPLMIFNKSRIVSLSNYLRRIFINKYPDTEIHYAIKACYSPEILKIFLKNKIKLEVMSEFEYKLVKQIGEKPSNLILNGPGKTDKLLRMAIKEDIGLINADSENEISRISKICKEEKKIAKIGLRIQPDVPQNSFLKRGEKLGVDEKSGQAEEIIKNAIVNPYIKLCGIQFHSFINQATGENISNALNSVIRFVKEMNNKYNFKPQYIDIGGGLATIENWEQNGIEKFANEIIEIINELKWKPKLILEPGRFLISDCAVVIAKIIRKKFNGDARWIIVNGNTNMLIPLASADFKVENVKCDDGKLVYYNVGDCLCSASGTLQRNVLLSDNLKEGDYIIIKNAGAYTVNLSEPFAEPIMPIFITEGNKLKLLHKGVDIEQMLEYFLNG